MAGITTVTGAHGAARGWVIAELFRTRPRLIVAVRDRKTSEELLSDIAFFNRSAPLFHLTGWETLPFEAVSPTVLTSAERIRALNALSGNEPHIVVVPADGLMQRALPLEFIRRGLWTAAPGESVPRAVLQQRLELGGFTRVPVVAEVGEYAVRGGVIDLFPFGAAHPVRLELSGSEIESIRAFDSDTQRSLHELQNISILPVREQIGVGAGSPFNPLLESGLARVKERAKSLGTPPSEIPPAIDALTHDRRAPGIELLQTIAFEHLAAPLAEAHADTTVVIDDEYALTQALDKLWETLEEREAARSADHFLVPRRETLAVPPDETLAALRRFRVVNLNRLQLAEESGAGKVRNIRSESHIELATRLKTRIGTGEAFEPLEAFMTKQRAAGYRIAFTVGSAVRADRLQRLLLQYGIDAPILSDDGLGWMERAARSPVAILEGHLSQGIKLPEQAAIFLSEEEVFGERSYRHQRARGAPAVTKRMLSSLAQLQEGDYIVHSDFGIGVYRGLKSIEVESSFSDFLQIDYLDSRLYLPVHSISKIQKFSAAEGDRPSVDRLGSNRWKNTKAKVRASVAALAGELIKLYAARSIAKGWRFEPYGAEDDRFADGFPFDETPDQLRAIEETLEDMAKEQPMDRLVCGDVGFGKTEVALRAAFKCTQHARQVAVLVPTTILVEQHKNNFAARFREYDVRVGAVSRFYSAQDNRETLQGLADGSVDVIIGTHRLLSKDVIFKDLGLVIIDEEHRFGVKQKERLKQLKRQVDVLTLTATPIPRTLYMSLLGIRDASVIATAPTDRRVIRTYVAAYTDSLVKDAITREMERGGQCFYIHNRVQNIDLVTSKLAQLVPDARFAFAHGQMSEKQLENIMVRYLNREIDVLVSTTIIESGLDIPNANTMIVERADNFGLAQLYQIRGRVGRSKRQAYAYLLIPKNNTLTVDAEQRLSVLQSLDDLGAGFQLALRDLEIRGAGNLLGKEQSGNVAAIGFELYTKILKEAVLHLKGEEVALEDELDPEVSIGFNAFIPEDYIPDISERLVMYQRLAALGSPEEAGDLTLEMEDRFGTVSSEVRNFVELMRLKWHLKQFGVVKLELTAERIILSFSPRAPLDGGKVAQMVMGNRESVRFSKSLVLTMTLGATRFGSPEEVESYLLNLFDTLRKQAA